MARRRYSIVVNWSSPDGYPTNPPPVDENGELDFEAGDREYEPDDENDSED